MNIVDTNRYFENKINESFLKNKNINNGLKEDLKGKGFEEILVSLCNKKDKTKEEKDLLNQIFKKKIKKAEVLSNKYKSDILIEFEDKTKNYISLKNTGNSMVGGLEITSKSFSDFFKNKKLKNSTEKYELERYTKGTFKKKYPNEAKFFEEHISENITEYLNLVIKGKGDNLPPDTIIFLDKKTNQLYISSIEEYIKLILKYGTKGTLGTYTSITRTSGKYCNMKIKIPNPLRIKKFKENKYIL